MKTLKMLYILPLMMLVLASCTAQEKKKVAENKIIEENKMIEIEIWSDIICPFCYIGKVNFEKALFQFEAKDQVKVSYKSFLLNPDMPTEFNEESVYAYLAKVKGISVEQSKQMHENVERMASQSGLNYNFDKAVLANPIRAHKLVQYASEQNLGGECIKLLYSGHFENGKDLYSDEFLMEVASVLGLEIEESKAAINSDKYNEAIEADIALARQFGINSVPCFVINRKSAISGAQPVSEFLKALKSVK